MPDPSQLRVQIVVQRERKVLRVARLDDEALPAFFSGVRVIRVVVGRDGRVICYGVILAFRCGH